MGSGSVRRLRRDIRLAALAALVIALVAGLFAAPQPVLGGTWNNAYTYYNSYGDSVVFEPYSRQGGNIYYATKAKTSTTNVLFRTLGWKMTIRGNNGENLQTLYYKLDGSYMSRIHTKTQSGYEYNLYSMHLDMLRNRLNARASRAFYNGECKLILNACMTTVKNGKVQGSMTDNGPASGKVYTTYGGISGAANWSAAAKQSLQSYFNKEIVGLFHNLRVSKGTGISKVTGSGYYCYGTRVTVEAKVKSGYTFLKWKGLESAKQIQHTFFINEGGTMTAMAEPLSLSVVMHRNYSSSDKTTKKQTVSYGTGGQKLGGNGWTKDGGKLLGWALAQGATQPNYAVNVRVDDSWVSKYAPQVHLYAVWKEDDDDDGEIDIVPPPSGPNPLTPLPAPSAPDPVPDAPLDPRPGSDPTPTPWTGQEYEEEEPEAEPELVFHIRFISSRYFEDAAGNLIPQQQGGLAMDSRWATESGMRSLLRAVIARD